MTAVDSLAQRQNLRSGSFAGLTAVWTFLIFLLPMYRVLPEVLRVGWFGAVFGLIIGSAAVLWVAKPAFPALWGFVALATVFATLTATELGDYATAPPSVVNNLFVGAQIAVMLGIGVFVMTANVVNAKRFLQSVSLGFVAGQSFSSAVGISQVTGLTPFGLASINDRSSGLASHPNVLGLLSTIAIIVCITTLLSGVGVVLQALSLTLLVVNVGGLLSSGSLSSLGAGLVGILVTLVALRDRVTRFVAVVAVSGSVLWLALAYTNLFSGLRTPADRYMQVTGQTDAESTWEIRRWTYEYAWDKIQDQPFFGVGLPTEFGATYDGVTLTHNFILRAWFQGGLLLGVAMASVAVAVLVVALRSVIRKEHAGPAGVLVAIIGFALTSAFFEQPDYWLPAVIAWAAISVQDRPASGIKDYNGGESPSPVCRESYIADAP